jgi:protein O-GlcNAc transferase
MCATHRRRVDAAVTVPLILAADMPSRRGSFEEALAWQQQGDLARADALCIEVIRLQPRHADAWHLRGILALQAGRFAQAVECFERALEAQGRQPAVHANLANALLESGQLQEALSHVDQADALQPNNALTLYTRARVLERLERVEDALNAVQRAVALLPDFAPAHVLRGKLLLQSGEPDDALASFECALRPNARDGGALRGRGMALHQVGRLEEALASFDAALRTDIGDAAAHVNRGDVLMDLLRVPQALECYEAALQLAPDSADALDSQGLALLMADRPAEAARAYSRLRVLAPGRPNVLGNLLYARMMCCDWSAYEADRDELLNDTRDAAQMHPFALLALTDSGAAQLSCGKKLLQSHRWARPAPLPPRMTRERLRVAYISADLRNHAVAFLLAGIFERHDRSRFETFGIALRPTDDSVMGRRVVAAFDRFIDVSNFSDRQIVDLLRQLRIDIAVDLMGYTRWSRPGIFAARVAPVQVNYLGYPGTMGAPFMDYLLADSFVVPPGSEQYYAEAIVRLPDCFQANDDRRILPAPASRATAGLPERGFVFCCLNATYKITPTLFDIWCRLVGACEGSVLWLLDKDELTRANLRREAATRGVAPDRLIFAPQAAYPTHLARLQQADLFLDTLPFNAGTTASDALWTGVPLLTLPGEAFAARMAGSLLRAAGADDLIATSLADYERKAHALAADPFAHAQLRARLRRARTKSALFDSFRFCRNLEGAYGIMHARACATERPLHITLPALPDSDAHT